MLDNWYCPTTADIRSAWCPVDYYYPLSKAAFLQLLIKGRPIVRVGSLHCSQTHSVSQRHPDPNTPLWNDGKFKSPHTLSPCLISQTLALCFFFFFLIPVKTVSYHLLGDVKFSLNPGACQRWRPRRTHVYNSSLTHVLLGGAPFLHYFENDLIISIFSVSPSLSVLFWC